jgi:hypothetical protein
MLCARSTAPISPSYSSSSTEVTAATDAPATPRVRSRPSIGVLLTSKEAADYLRVSSSWLAKARMRGDGPPFITIGPRCVRYADLALVQWMKSRQRLSTHEE